MNIFKTGVKDLQTKSIKALDIFNKTVTELQSVNDQAEKAMVERQTEIDRLRDEFVSLNSLKSQNNSIIDKINQILK